MARVTLLLLTMACAPLLHAQEAEHDIRKGNSAFEKGKLQEAADAYSKARTDERGMFNLGNALYRMDSIGPARQSYENAVTMSKDPAARAKAWHNVGNSWMRQKKFEEAINAYKEGLKLAPNDADTRYNLAYAQKMLARQQQQQKKQDQQKKDQQKQDQQNKDQQKQDQQKQDQQKQDQQDKDQQKKDQQDKDQQQQGKEGDQKKDQQQERINPQDAQRMLDAAEQQEKNVQDKVRRLMQPKPASPPEKDW
jgi:tetratricopeptide (TPR) repeat protein